MPFRHDATDESDQPDFLLANNISLQLLVKTAFNTHLAPVNILIQKACRSELRPPHLV